MKGKNPLRLVPPLEHHNIVALRRAEQDILDSLSVAWVNLLRAARTADRDGRSETHFALTRIQAELDEVMDDVRKGRGPKGPAA